MVLTQLHGAGASRYPSSRGASKPRIDDKSKEHDDRQHSDAHDASTEREDRLEVGLRSCDYFDVPTGGNCPELATPPQQPSLNTRKESEIKKIARL